ncbi:hypothetical protein I4U23_015347 [Adineta vaga]|nr:hypothetical protein I4U23_015347 [Adineta vaga]
MFYVVFFALLSLTLTPIGNAVLCANNCNFASNLNNPTPPTCTYVDKPVSEHSCQVVLTIDYNSGAVNGILNSKIPPTSPNFDGVTVFSLAREAANLTIEFDCSDTDKCDFTFVDNLLKSDWSKLLNQLKPLRNVLVDMLIDSTTLDSNATCPARQPCSGTGFCRMVYKFGLIL